MNFLAWRQSDLGFGFGTVRVEETVKRVIVIGMGTSGVQKCEKVQNRVKKGEIQMVGLAINKLI